MHAVYIHIPFCEKICTYCDFCKVLYNSKWISSYLDALEVEINEHYQGEEITTIYIGGGTPSSLSIDELKRLFKIISNIKKCEQYEYTIECNIESITEEKIKLFKEYGVNRISIGIQTFNSKFLKNMNREVPQNAPEIISIIKDYGISINVDLMYALPGETIEELKEDLEQFLKLPINHISTYSLMIEPNTVWGIRGQKNVSEELDFKMYEIICSTLKEHGFIHYEVSNFAHPGYESRHNLTYWNNEEYYGFGMGASGYIGNIRYTNTKNLEKYMKCQFLGEAETLTIKEQMENEMILGLRKLEGVSETKFKEKYDIEIKEAFSIKQLLNEGKLIRKDGYLKIPESNIYISNDILIYFIGE